MKIYKKYREFENFMAWAKQEFGYLIPQEYLNFLEKEKNVEKMYRMKYYVINAKFLWRNVTNVKKSIIRLC